MEERFHSLTQKIFKKDPSGVTNEEAQALASQYPYFAPIHFIRLLQLTEGTEAYQQQYQKSILYYPDPLSFELFVQTEDNAGWDANLTIEDHEGTRHVEIAVEPVEEHEIQLAPLELKPVVKEDPESTPAEPVHERLSPEPSVELVKEEEEGVAAPQVSSQEELLPQPASVLPASPVAELTFEPYHTVDYFASQGIKITSESVSGDKFGKQVKSFTDWLKTMKRLPPAELGKNVTPTTERKVENLAEHSVVDADVVTESMAQVWEKQGNITKATEVYHKLSLQNPSKRAYFAAKIDKLTEEN